MNAADACPHVVEQPEWSQTLGTHDHGDACEDPDCLPSLMHCTACPTVDACRQAKLCAQPWRLVRVDPPWLEAR